MQTNQVKTSVPWNPTRASLGIRTCFPGKFRHSYDDRVATFYDSDLSKKPKKVNIPLDFAARFLPQLYNDSILMG